jgi:prepilin-type N-terminal cleavage/methylation domain-containing protein
MHSPRLRQAFTLIELLVVIAIIAILSVVVILTLNPAALLQQSRDSNRISDMSTLNTALGIYLAQGGASLGSANTVYVSIPDPTATSTAGDQCQGLGLISLPLNYSYHCAATSTYRNVDGTGWIPVNFALLPAGAPLGQLPQDPINTTSSREYYTYTTNGTQYETTAVMESQKYQLGGSNDVISNDGGRLASVYEKGNAYGLEPLDYGDNTLVGWWNFNEGTGTIAYDYSGSNATGSWSGTQTGSSGTYYSPGKVGPYAGAFDGGNNYIDVGTSTMGKIAGSTSPMSISIWINNASSTCVAGQSYNCPILGNGSYQSGGFVLGYINANLLLLQTNQSGNNSGVASSSTSFAVGSWLLIAVTFDGSNMDLYINGSLVTTVSSAQGPGPITNHLYLGSATQGGWAGHYFSGLIDDVRVYNRALTAAQIAAMYAGGK